MDKNKEKRVVSGMRTTGHMHLGHYHSVLKNWLVLQERYKCFFFAADLHAMTTHYEHALNIEKNTFKMLKEWISVGIDPDKSCIFVQSFLSEHSELHLLLSMITPVNWLNRTPSYKDKNNKSVKNYGFLGYPVLQSSDILLYNPDYVPIGEDQVSHIEITRKISRRFNLTFGEHTSVYDNISNIRRVLDKEELIRFLRLIKKYKNSNCLASLNDCKNIIINSVMKKKKGCISNFLSRKKILKEPKVLLGKYPKIIGLDGRKMSKSYNNTIGLVEPQHRIHKKILQMPTDPARIRISDPGNPEKCPVWNFHLLYSNESEKLWIKSGCKSASIGCIDCKKDLSNKIDIEHSPIRDNYNSINFSRKYVEKIIQEGKIEARKIADKTLHNVKEAINFLL